MSSERSRPARLGSGLLLSLLLILPASAAPAPPSPPSPAAPVPQGKGEKQASLTLEVSPWTLASRPLRITVSQSGVLEGRRLAILLFVDGNQFERITTSADRTEASLVLPAVGPGPHLLVARSGNEVAEAGFRVISRAWAFGALLLMALAVALGVRASRRRRRG